VTQTDSLIGSVLGGRYEIVARVNRGGTAVVYRGIDRRLGRTVAVKVIHSDLSGDPEYVKRFDREARAAAILSHPNIVAVFDQGRAGERPYIVMEFIHGQSLRSIISSSAPLPPALALGYADDVAKALAAAHEAGLIHRDIKPENVLITNDGQVKVTDFGLAKTVATPTSSASQGMLMGTMSYMAPEIPQSGTATMASDIYSTGVVMYEMLTGKKPHVGDDYSQVIYKHVHEDVPPPSLALAGQARAKIPDYVDALVTACTSRNSDLRPANGRVLEEKIAKARRGLEAGLMHDAGLVREFTNGSAPEKTPVAPPSRPVPVAKRQTENTPVHPLSAAAPVPKLTKAAPAGTARPPTRTPRQRRRRRGPLVAGIIGLAIVVAGVATLGWYLAAGRWVTVPPVAGLTEQQAQTNLAAASLEMTTLQAYSETVKAGLVIQTDPAVGARVTKHTTVTAVISKGAERYPMPTVEGLTEDAAGNAIKTSHLQVGTITQVWSETVPEGQVVSASQKAGASLKPGTAIDLSVSKGRQPIPIASYVGKAGKDATDGLTKAGFAVSTSQANSCDVATGNVISQKPAPDSKTPDLTGFKNDPIALVISKGPVMAKVPSVFGKGLEDAKTALTDAGFPSSSIQENNVNATGVTLHIAVSTAQTDGSTLAAGSTVSTCDPIVLNYA